MIYSHVILHPSEQIGMHSQSSWELDYIVKGHGMRSVGTDTGHFSEGDLVLVYPGMEHVWIFDDEPDEIENIAIFWEPAYLKTLKVLSPEFEQVVNDFESIAESLELRGELKAKIAELMIEMGGQNETERFISFLRIINLLSKRTDTVIAGHQRSGKSPLDRIRQVETYVSCNYNRELFLSKVASIAGMSETSFCTFWKRETGRTFKAYLIDYRISIAKYLLSLPDKRISEICYECGFADIPHFCRTFKKLSGMSPSQYRLSQTGNASI